MVPFTSFASTRWTSGSPRLERFNGVPSMNIWGEPAPGRSSGEAMKAMEEIVAKLPAGVGFDWPDLEGVVAKVHEELGEVLAEALAPRPVPRPRR